MKKVTVIDYLIERLHEIGVDDIFGVPGDYNLSFLDDVESGARGVSLNKLMLLSQILNVSTDFLLFGNEQIVSDQVFSHIIENCPNNKRKALASILQKIIESYIE